MKNIFIGVDGGGSKTRVLIEDENGNKIGRGIGGASNIRLSVDNAWKSIYDALDQALDNTGISLKDKKYNFHAGMGLAGVSIIDAKNKFLNMPNPFKTFLLESDAHIACLGANKGNDGAIVSIGTGIIGYSICNSMCFRVGGWGFPHADTAGGAWFGMEVTRLTFSWLDGCIPVSPVLENIFAHFDNNLSRLIQWANAADSSQFATLAPYVVKGLESKDSYSEKLFNTAAKEIDLLINALLNKNPKIANSNLPCILMGGLAPFIEPFLKIKHIPVNKDEDAAIKGALHLLSFKYHGILKCRNQYQNQTGL